MPGRPRGRQRLTALQRAFFERLDRRVLLTVSAAEQHFIYELNRARHDPVAYAVEQDLSISLAYVQPRPAVAVNTELTNASGFKSDEMADRDYFSHTSVTGETPNQLVRRFGYDLPMTVPVDGTTYLLPESGNMVESLAGGTTTVEAALRGLILSEGHRNHLLGITAHNKVARDVGIGYRAKSGTYWGHYWTVLITPASDSDPRLTGVVFNDGNANTRYNQSEGVGGVTITASGPSGTFTTTTLPQGGWSMRVLPGSYVVTASGGSFVGVSSVPVAVSSDNVAIDFISGQESGWVDFAKHVNTAPVLDTSPVVTFPPVVVGNRNPAGTTVAELLSSAFSDTDPLSGKGMAITSASSSTFGAWQYSIDGGISWAAVGTPSVDAARLLRGQDFVRFVPDGSVTGSATIDYRAWDQTTGIVGGVADTGGNGGTTAFSTSIETATITTLVTNTAPTLVGGGGLLDPVAEDTQSPMGTTIASLLGQSFVDADPGTPSGIGITGVAGGQGAWQFSLDEGASWSGVGPIVAGAALPLRSQDRIRFVPALNFYGTSSIFYRAWDRSSGTAGIVSSPALTDGEAAFGVTVATAVQDVTPVNDAPAYVAGAASLRLRPVPVNASLEQWAAVGTTVRDLLGNSVNDIDPTPSSGIAVVGTSGDGTFWWNNGSGGFTSIAALPSFATLLRSTDVIYFAPSNGFAGTASLSFRLWDRTSGTVGHSGANLSNPATATGGTTAFGAELLTGTIFVGSAGSAPTGSFGTATRASDGRTVASIPITFTKPIGGLDLADFRLTRNSLPVSLSSASLSGSGTQFALAGLGDATFTAGTYVLSISTAQSGITDEAGNPLSAGPTTTFTVNAPVNRGPSDLLFTNTVAFLPESVDTGVAIRVADLTMVDDGLGTNTVSVSGDDAAAFQVVDGRLFLKAGAALDYGLKSNYSVTVAASDATVSPAEPPASRVFTLTIGNVPEHSGREYLEISAGHTITDTAPRSGARRLVIRGAGTVFLDAGNLHSGGTVVESGEVVVRHAGAFGSGLVEVHPGATLRLAVGTSIMDVPSLDLRTGGRIDVGTGRVRLPAGSFTAASLRTWIVNGRAGGAWSGLGIGSSEAAAGSQRAVGYRILPDGTAVIGWAAFGDANLDGRVNSSDLNLLLAGGRYGGGSTDARWSDGDFNYDGRVNSQDLNMLLVAGLFNAASYYPTGTVSAASFSGPMTASGQPPAGKKLPPTLTLGLRR